MQDFHQLAELCKTRKIYIQTHNFPDPDAIGSAFGLQRLLAHFGIESTLCYMGQIDKLSASKMLDAFHIQMISYEQLQGRMTEKDGIICVDCQKNGGNTANFVGEEIACIDHHPTFTRENYQYAELHITGACATLISRYYKSLNITPDMDVATALLYGLRMDTLQFSRGVTQLDIEMFGYLFPFCDHQKLFWLEKNNMKLQDLQAYGAVINSIAVYGKTGFAEIPFHCPDGLIATMSDFILSLEEVKVTVVFCRRNGGIKLSVRSELQEIHAGYLVHEALTGLGDGGGHQQMAGGMIPEDVVKTLQPKAELFLRERFLNLINRMDCRKQ